MASMPSNSGRASFIDSSKYSFFSPHVPGLQVTRQLVRDRARRVREAGVQAALGVERRQVLEQVARVAGDEVGVLGAVEPRILLLEHVRAGRSGHDDLPSLADRL